MVPCTPDELISVKPQKMVVSFNLKKLFNNSFCVILLCASNTVSVDGGFLVMPNCNFYFTCARSQEPDGRMVKQ